MTTEQISAIAGVLLSLLFSYAPKLREWYEALDATYKRLVMLGALLAVVAGAFGLSCAGQASAFTCDGAGAWVAVRAFISALVANQATYLITPKAPAPEDVQHAG